MRRLLPLLFLFACGTKRPAEDAHVIARPGEPCFQRLKPWEEEAGPPIKNTQNLPQCPPKVQNVDLGPLPEGGLRLSTPIFIFGADAGRD